MARDPVCGMQVDEQQAAAQGLTSEYEGQTYFFCSSDDKRRFDEDPRRYAGQPPDQR